MANASHGPDSPQTPPLRPRHQITRSISDIAVPSKSITASRPPYVYHRSGISTPTNEASLSPRSFLARESTSSLDIPQLDSTTTATAALIRSQSALITNHSYPASGDESLAPPQMPMPAASAAVPVSPPEPTTNTSPPTARLDAVATSQLYSTFSSLREFATSSTRRLDETYFTVLARLNTLHTTLLTLRKLAADARTVEPTFRREADTLARETRSQIATFGRFEEQEQRIQSLQTRVRAGRSKIAALSERVDKVRVVVEGWERADNEWQERTRRRLKATWIVMSSVGFAITILFMSARWATQGPISTSDVWDLMSNGTGNISLGSDTSPLIDTMFTKESPALDLTPEYNEAIKEDPIEIPNQVDINNLSEDKTQSNNAAQALPQENPAVDDPIPRPRRSDDQLRFFDEL